MNNLIINNTVFYIWNESRLINSKDLNDFCVEINKKSMFDFNLIKKDTCISLSLLNNCDLNVKFFDSGYVFFVEGKIINGILFLYEFDRCFNQNKKFYISPTQRLDDDTKFLFPRGAKIKEIAEFLDEIFRNNDYSIELKKYSF
jgi:hypothetical protein